jgi:hypothetical protein
VIFELEIDMIRDAGKFELWAELGFLLRPVAVGASFEGLAIFLISGVAETRLPPRSVQSDHTRKMR